MSPDQFTYQVELTTRKNRLAWYEREIEKRGSAFTAILRELRDDPLKPYLATHGSLAEYLEDRWGMTPRRQNQLMAAQNVREQIASEDPEIAGVVMNMKEGPIRELSSGVPKEKRAQVLRDAMKSSKKGRITAIEIKQAKARVVDPKPVEDPVLDEEVLPKAANVEPVKCPHCGGVLP